MLNSSKKYIFKNKIKLDKFSKNNINDYIDNTDVKGEIGTDTRPFITSQTVSESDLRR